MTRALLWSNGLVFGLQWLLGNPVFTPFALWPWGSAFLPWQVLTYGFLHGDPAHLFFNLLALMMFGSPVEQAIGTRRFAIYYFTCLVGAGLVQLAVATISFRETGQPYPTVGASGGVFGLLLAFGMLFPQQKVMLLFPPIPMKAWVLVVGYGALELFLGVTRTQSGVAHFAHLGGMAFGVVLMQYWRGRWPFRPQRRP